MGDLSENAEYHMAKQRQVFVNARLGQLKKRMGELSMVNLANIPNDKVGFGATVMVFDSSKDEEIMYKLVTSEESDVSQGPDLDHFADRARAAGQEGRRYRHRGYTEWQARAGDFEADDDPRRGASNLTDDERKSRPDNRSGKRDRSALKTSSMTWTSAFGRGSGWLLQKIVNGLALTRISPNALTFHRTDHQRCGGLLFGFARVHNANRMFLYRRADHHRRGHLRHGGRRVARQTNQVSVFGAFFDSVMDRYSDVAIFFGLLVLLRSRQPALLCGPGAFVMTACVMVSYTRARAEALIGTCKVGFMERPERIVCVILGRACATAGA